MRRQATRLIIPAKKLLFSATRIDSGLGGSVKCLYFRGDAFPSSSINDGAFTSSAEADAQCGLGRNGSR